MSFDGQAIDAVAWSRDSRSILVSSTSRVDGVPSLRELVIGSRQPVFEQSDAAMLVAWNIALGPNDEAYWIDQDQVTSVVRRERSGVTEPIATLPTPRFIFLTSTAAGLQAIGVEEQDGIEVSTLFSIDGSGLLSVARTFGSEIVESYATSPDGKSSTVALSGGPETKVRFETSVADGTPWTYTPEGKLVGGPAPLPNGLGLLYLDHDIGAVRGVMRDGRAFGVMNRSVSGIRVASDGRLAYITLEQSGDNSVCVTSTAIAAPSQN